MTRKNQIEFVRRLMARKPEAAEFHASVLRGETLALTGGREDAGLAGMMADPSRLSDAVLETIVRRERPVFFVHRPSAPQPMRMDLEDAAILGPDAQELTRALALARDRIEPLFARVGRIDLEGLAGLPYVGTGWIVDAGVVITNRHVAETFARRDGARFTFRMGGNGRPLRASFDTGHLRGEDDTGGDAVDVSEILYVEPESSPFDIAFLKLAASSRIPTLSRLPISHASSEVDEQLCAIGYPARASRRLIPDQELMRDLFREQYDVKRVAPGRVLAETADTLTHDCTTLGGNSGCAIVSLRSGHVVGLHYAGVYLSENRAVPSSILGDYASRKKWLQPISVETGLPRPNRSPQRAGATTITVTIAIDGGAVNVTTGSGAAATDQTAVEAAAARFLDLRIPGVVAARTAYLDEGHRIGTAPCIAISVVPSRLAAVRAEAPAVFHGHVVRFEPATVTEQLDVIAEHEEAAQISYDDGARGGSEFSLAQVTEQMSVRAHVSPEYGFDELRAFLSKPDTTELTSAMFEFKGAAIADLIEESLRSGTRMQLAVDNATLPVRKKPRDEDEKPNDLEFDAAVRFEEWRTHYAFEVTKVPEGRRGLIKNSYHIKVTVRDDDCFWLSSGNWKNTSSQPLVTDRDRERALDDDLPGNRDWHVVVRSPSLSKALRAHIRQDIVRSGELGPGLEGVEADWAVSMPYGETEFAEERRPPSRLLLPLEVTGEVKAQPLLTPDRDGRVYTDAVLALIRSARRSLCFQIPYIGMRRDPRVHRGNIDELIDALVDKLLEINDARVLLRTGNSAFSDNRHVAWYLRSKGVDIETRLRAIDDHHTKGMIVDGQRVLVGSHNWSGDGVSSNRDASIVFDDDRIAGYFGEAFDIDWQRAVPVKARRFEKEAHELVRMSISVLENPGVDVLPLRDYLAAQDD